MVMLFTMPRLELVNTLSQVLAGNIDQAGRFLLGQFGLICQLGGFMRELVNCEYPITYAQFIKIGDITSGPFY